MCISVFTTCQLNVCAGSAHGASRYRQPSAAAARNRPRSQVPAERWLCRQGMLVASRRRASFRASRPATALAAKNFLPNHCNRGIKRRCGCDKAWDDYARAQ